MPKSVPGTSTYTYDETETGLALEGKFMGGTPPTTANTFAIGCILLDTSTGKTYRNVGSSAAPEWELQMGFGTSVSLTPTAAETEGVNVIPPEAISVRLGANVNDTDDFVVLPALATVENGHEVTIIAGAANCEVRTPASSAEEINSEDCDGTKEYLLAATTIHKFIKIDDTIGWMGHGYTAIGAVVTAVVPD